MIPQHGLSFHGATNQVITITSKSSSMSSSVADFSIDFFLFDDDDDEAAAVLAPAPALVKGFGLFTS